MKIIKIRELLKILLKIMFFRIKNLYNADIKYFAFNGFFFPFVQCFKFFKKCNEKANINLMKKEILKLTVYANGLLLYVNDSCSIFLFLACYHFIRCTCCGLYE